MNKLYLDAERLCSRREIMRYMDELFPDEEGYARNLDSLYDSLTEIEEETEVILKRDAVIMASRLEYAYRLLKVFSKAAAENPYFHVVFR